MAPSTVPLAAVAAALGVASALGMGLSLVILAVLSATAVTIAVKARRFPTEASADAPAVPTPTADERREPRSMFERADDGATVVPTERLMGTRNEVLHVAATGSFTSWAATVERVAKSASRPPMLARPEWRSFPAILDAPMPDDTRAPGHDDEPRRITLVPDECAAPAGTGQPGVTDPVAMRSALPRMLEAPPDVNALVAVARNRKPASGRKSRARKKMDAAGRAAHAATPPPPPVDAPPVVVVEPVPVDAPPVDVEEHVPVGPPADQSAGPPSADPSLAAAQQPVGPLSAAAATPTAFELGLEDLVLESRLPKRDRRPRG